VWIQAQSWIQTFWNGDGRKHLDRWSPGCPISYVWFFQFYHSWPILALLLKLAHLIRCCVPIEVQLQFIHNLLCLPLGIVNESSFAHRHAFLPRLASIAGCGMQWSGLYISTLASYPYSQHILATHIALHPDKWAHLFGYLSLSTYFYVLSILFSPDQTRHTIRQCKCRTPLA